jgi:hypothetical protein
MWDESKAGRGGNEIASEILKWAGSCSTEFAVDEITIWTDNCYGQNKNMSAIVRFIWILHKCGQVKRINHKLILKGHPHMEANTIHAQIETKLRKFPTILTPRNWHQVVRHTATKFTVHNMELQYFMSFKCLYNASKISMLYRKYDVNREPLKLSQCSHLHVEWDNLDSLFLKGVFNIIIFKK